MDLNKLVKIYSINYLDGTELMYIQSIKKLKDWDAKNDKEKLEYRKNQISFTKKFFEEDPQLPLNETGVIFLEKLLLFLEESEPYFIDFEYADLPPSLKMLFRVRNLFYFEKEMIIRSPGINGSQMHLPLNLIESLIEKMDVSDRENYQINHLFSIFKHLIELQKDFTSNNQN